MVFNADLVDLVDVNDVWKWIDEQEGSQQMGSKWDGVRAVLRMVDGWTPPPTPSISKEASVADEQDRDSAEQPQVPNANQQRANAEAKKRKKQNKTKQNRPAVPTNPVSHTSPSPSATSLPTPSSDSTPYVGAAPPPNGSVESPREFKSNGRGRGSRGRGRGGYRGRGAPRGFAPQQAS